MTINLFFFRLPTGLRKFSILCLLTSLPSLLYAQSHTGMTPIMPVKEFLCGSPAPWPEIPNYTDEAIHLQADEAHMHGDNITTFSGSVIINQIDTQLSADQVRYFKNTEEVDAQGNVHVLTPGLQLWGSNARYNLAQENGIVNYARYLTIDEKKGVAKNIEIIDPARIALNTASYTSCNTEDPDWLLTASRLKLDTESRQGYATHSVVRFKGVPFFYFPYMRFPIGDARLTGLLFPNIGDSRRHGLQVQAPFYWNIAPDRDATITPWYMAKRGAMLMTEFRYLNPGNNGQLELDYLNNDKLYGASRGRVKWKHQSTAINGWATQIDYNRVNDPDYFLDFGTTINNSNPTHLQQKAALSYNARNWNMSAQMQAYQKLSGSTPYERLPQLTFNTRFPERENEWHPGFKAEVVTFTRNDDSVQGSRLNMTPYLSLPLSNEAMFLTPKLSWQLTAYDLKNTSAEQTPNASREAPIFSVNSGLFFERSLSLGDSDLLQTLEPQLFYVYAPYREQDDIAVFDSGQVGFNINDPFRENQFTGADRVEDANRLTAMLTTRFLDEASGAERLMARIGQLYYFADRRVTLPGGSVQTSRRSPIIAELISRPFKNLYVVTNAQWDPEIKDYSNGNFYIEYQPTTRLDFRMNYRYQKNSLETNEGRLRWRITPNWYIGGRKLYDIRYHRQQESEYSLQYDSCCWAFKLSTRQRFFKVGEPDEKSIYFELELKGLSSFGAGMIN